MRHLFLSFCLFLAITLSAQEQKSVDFISGDLSITVFPEQKQVNGTVTYTFDILKPVDSIFLDAKNINFTALKLNGKKVKYVNDEKHIIIKKRFKKGKSQTLHLSYEVQPTQTVYFIGWEDDASKNKQIWTQGQGKYTSHWLPSFDDMNEKVVFDTEITFDSTYQVIASGKLIDAKKNANDITTWSYDMKQPMSSYLLAFAIAKYDKKTVASNRGVPLELFYYPEDSIKFEPTYRYSKEIFDFLEREIGLDYPWQNYKQVPVKDFLYAGMENTTTTIFSDGYMIDSIAFVDKNYININAHELAHQWFGNLVTEANGQHHWLQEGFATYYAQLAEKELFGSEYHFWKLFDTAETLTQQSKEGKGESLKNPKASSLTFYEKGAWALALLKEEVGTASFKKGIQNYLEKYKFKNVKINDFLVEIEKASGQSLNDYDDIWLGDTEFPMAVAFDYLKNNSSSISDFISLQESINKVADKKVQLSLIENAYDESNSIEFKKRLILTYAELFSIDFMKKIIASNDLMLRQALSLKTIQIPSELQTDFESLLEDQSYSTIENSLYRLFLNFPEQRKTYLDQTKDIIGFSDKNVRLLWLTLALVTEDYNSLKTKDYFDELGSYTQEQYDPKTREAAFQYLFQTFGLTDTNLGDLAKASIHHSWQFKKFARALFDELLKDEAYKDRIIALLPELNEKEKLYLTSKLE
ncbi:M1 family metallopeptidase [Cellulophaga sp. HaHa_2_95]|uniref:M1 family metallopeptidase n=1 Tax=Cellulophaga sp. HaHa_2_95 TaxID=2745558 RepID=UPI001C500A3C|nr:M1 family metallopeptidase [Cellulophaga sp. HaHa_2_95]QXP54741.1 M1 family metallopeptidase [Cellulophaga sp. HaHa_2_95]